MPFHSHKVHTLTQLIYDIRSQEVVALWELGVLTGRQHEEACELLVTLIRVSRCRCQCVHNGRTHVA